MSATACAEGAPDPLDAALLAWRSILPEAGILTAPAQLAAYQTDTSDFSQAPSAVLKPASRDQVRQVLAIAREHGLPVHPISTGHNWGYGSANAYVAGCVVLDLSGMTAIRHFEPELGLVTLEPGVTQAMLRDWLDARGFRFMVPTTGAGPRCSLVGNALERGYGLTPHADHFAAVTALEAVLPDGTVYRSPLADEAGGSGFRWGVGPYLDGLFSQGNLGVVTAMTIALAARPARVETFYFWIDRDADLEHCVAVVRDTLRDAGSSIGGINLISAARFLAMAEHEREHGFAPRARPLGQAEVEARAKAAGAAAWMGIGAIYGTAAHAAATRKLVRARIGGIARRLVFATRGKARLMERAMAWLPGERSRRLGRTLRLMREGLELLEGQPREVALPLAYLRSGKTPEGQPRNPAHDGCGLLWYAPIVAMTGTRAREFVDMARAICLEHGFDASITLSSLSERCFDCTLPILFDRHDPADCARADACWRALYHAGLARGFRPYRVHARYAQLLASEATPFWTAVDTIKRALDPDDLVSPGRWQARAGR